MIFSLVFFLHFLCRIDMADRHRLIWSIWTTSML